MIELIGTNAGLVWNVLNEGGKMSFKAVKKATKIKAEKDMYAAFGWLAKEGKLAFEEIEGEMYVPEQPRLIFWSLILMEMDVRKFVVKREMVLSMDWDIG